jgi:hypothetical protein
MKKIFFFMLLAIFLISTAAAEQSFIKLKTGEIVKGNILEQSEYYVRINVAGENKLFLADEIEAIDKEGTGFTINTSGKKIVTGLVNFDAYHQGPIYVRAFVSSPEIETQQAIARTKIDGPGPYTLYIPKEIPSVFILACNDSDNHGLPMQPNHDPCFYTPEPISLTEQVTTMNFSLTEATPSKPTQ